VVNREPIRDGVRFSLPGCPNALAWTVAVNLEFPGEVVVHCTINRRKPDVDFSESIRQFVDAWIYGPVKLRLKPCCPVEQKLQFRAQPTTSCIINPEST